MTLDSWAEADDFRKSYTDGNDGHTRSARIYRTVWRLGYHEVAPPAFDGGAG